MKVKGLKRCVAAALSGVMLFSFTACAKTEPPKEQVPENPHEAIEQMEIEANKAGSMWELVCRMFPDYVIFKDTQNNFTYQKVNKDLALDTYDWSNLSDAKKGIDVSKYQGNIEWSKVKADDIEYAFIRVGYRGYGPNGNLVLDEKFEQNMVGALQNDIAVGVYFVTKATSVEEAQEEAKYVLELIKPYNVTYPVVIDIEPTASTEDRTGKLTAEERTTYVKAFCDTVKDAGYTPMIYGGVGCFMKYLEFERLEGIEKWFAQYFNQPWLRYEFGIWQSTDKGSVSGIKGNVDIDFCVKDYTKK